MIPIKYKNTRVGEYYLAYITFNNTRRITSRYGGNRPDMMVGVLAPNNGILGDMKIDATLSYCVTISHEVLKAEHTAEWYNCHEDYTVEIFELDNIEILTHIILETI